MLLQNAGTDIANIMAQDALIGTILICIAIRILSVPEVLTHFLY